MSAQDDAAAEAAPSFVCTERPGATLDSPQRLTRRQTACDQGGVLYRLAGIVTSAGQPCD
jgi:hypothetical protein